MRFSRFLKFTVMGTILALIYIQMQMQIIKLAYQGKFKEKQIKKLIEENGHVTYSILTMKSSDHLGGRLLAENSDMEFAGPKQVVKLAMPDQMLKKTQPAKVEKKADRANALLSLISLRSQAEARPQELILIPSSLTP